MMGGWGWWGGTAKGSHIGGEKNFRGEGYLIIKCNSVPRKEIKVTLCEFILSQGKKVKGRPQTRALRRAVHASH